MGSVVLTRICTKEPGESGIRRSETLEVGRLARIFRLGSATRGIGSAILARLAGDRPANLPSECPRRLLLRASGEVPASSLRLKELGLPLSPEIVEEAPARVASEGLRRFRWQVSSGPPASALRKKDLRPAFFSRIRTRDPGIFAIRKCEALWFADISVISHLVPENKSTCAASRNWNS